VLGGAVMIITALGSIFVPAIMNLEDHLPEAVALETSPGQG